MTSNRRFAAMLVAEGNDRQCSYSGGAAIPHCLRWMAQRYQQTGHLPSGAERLDYLRQTAADKRMKEAWAALDPRQGVQADNGNPSDSPSSQPLRHSVMDPLSIAGGISQLNGKGLQALV